MTATETWEQREERVKQEWCEIKRMVVRLEAGVAQKRGIDIFEPGWRDEYLELLRSDKERHEHIDSLIGTPHVGDAIAGMEEQFGGGTS